MSKDSGLGLDVFCMGLVVGVLIGMIAMAVITLNKVKAEWEYIQLPDSFRVGDYVKTTQEATKLLKANISICRVYRVDGDVIYCIDINGEKSALNEYWLTEVKP